MSCPHAHQQNGATERKHRHIVEVGLTILAHAAMPLKFWDEAFSTAVYLINRLPSKVIASETPHERLLKQPPDYSSLRVFGCACWPNLRPFNPKKLAFRSTRCVFLGYSGLHKGFKCLEPSTGRVYVSRDVVFDEQVFPFQTLHPNAGAQLRKEISLLLESLLPPCTTFGNGNLRDPSAVLSPTTDLTSSVEHMQQQTTGNSKGNGILMKENHRFPLCFLGSSSTDLGDDSPAPLTPSDGGAVPVASASSPAASPIGAGAASPRAGAGASGSSTTTHPAPSSSATPASPHADPSPGGHVPATSQENLGAGSSAAPSPMADDDVASPPR